MKTSIKNITFVVVAILSLAACSSTQSLQEYYVDNSENSNFLQIDVPASLLNLESVDLTDKQREAINSVKKLNILAFKKTKSNVVEFVAETAKVKAILKDKKYVQLMKIKSSYGKGVVKYLGDEDAIDEVIIFGAKDDQGFALIRILGKDMNPANLIELVKAIEKSDYKGEGLGGLEKFLGK
ncbi:MAG: DUF4252 domain-containing protein [Cellulophaga sp.]